VLTHHHIQPSRPSRVVLLGANGFIGRNLAAKLAANGLPVVAIGRDQVDLTKDSAQQKLSAWLQIDDTIVFLAALTPDKGRGTAAFLANVHIGEVVCSALERTPPSHVVYFSSDAVYPLRGGLVDEQSPAEPTDLYGAMHIARELMMRQATKAPLAVLRPSLVFGAGDTHNSYGPNRFRRMAKDGRITLFGDGEETRDHIYIDDVVSLTELTILHGSTGTLNLATGQSISFRDMAERVANLFPTKINIVGTPRQNPVTHRSYDVTAIHRAFPEFRFTPLDHALAAAHRE
jgi:UDP-glucose 4-epimerase